MSMSLEIDELVYLKVDELAPNPTRARVSFPHDSLVKLSDSIREYGLLNPLLVALTPVGYQIISGERRWRASKLAGLKTIPAIVKKINPEDILFLSLIENIQREDLTIFEQGSAIQRLQNEFGFSKREIAEKLGLEEPDIEKRLKLLKLSDKTKNEILSRKITDREALEMIDQDTEQKVYREVVKKSRYTF